MLLAGAVTGLATNVAALVILQRQAGVGGTGKMRGLLFVALGALFRPDEIGAGDLRRRDDGALGGDAGDHQEPPD